MTQAKTSHSDDARVLPACHSRYPKEAVPQGTAM
jgi:hypothetical protein